MAGLPREVGVLTAVAFAVAVGFGVVAPAIPVFAREFGVGHTAAGAVISAFAFMRLVSALGSGRLVNRFGERVVLATGIGIVAVSSALAGPLADLHPAAAAARRRRRRLGDVHRLGDLAAAAGRRRRPARPGHRHVAVRLPARRDRRPRDRRPAHRHLAARAVLRLRRHARRRRRHRHDLPHPGALHDDDAATAQRAPAVTLPQALRVSGYRAALVSNLGNGWALFGVRSSLIPLFVTEGMGKSATWTGIGFFVSAAAQGGLLLPAGSFTDRVGRRPALLIGGAARDPGCCWRRRDRSASTWSRWRCSVPAPPSSPSRRARRRRRRARQGRHRRRGVPDVGRPGRRRRSAGRRLAGRHVLVRRGVRGHRGGRRGRAGHRGAVDGDPAPPGRRGPGRASRRPARPADPPRVVGSPVVGGGGQSGFGQENFAVWCRTLARPPTVGGAWSPAGDPHTGPGDLVRAYDRCEAALAAGKTRAIAAVADSYQDLGMPASEARHEIGAALRLSPVHRRGPHRGRGRPAGPVPPHPGPARRGPDLLAAGGEPGPRHRRPARRHRGPGRGRGAGPAAAADPGRDPPRGRRRRRPARPGRRRGAGRAQEGRAADRAGPGPGRAHRLVPAHVGRRGGRRLGPRHRAGEEGPGRAAGRRPRRPRPGRAARRRRPRPAPRPRPAARPHADRRTAPRPAASLARCSCGGKQVAAVVIDAATLLGLADNPGRVPGYGLVPADLARDGRRPRLRPLARRPRHRRAARRRRRHLPAQRSARPLHPRPRPALRLPRLQPSRRRAAELDHVRPFSFVTRGGKTIRVNLGPLCGSTTTPRPTAAGRSPTTPPPAPRPGPAPSAAPTAPGAAPLRT